MGKARGNHWGEAVATLRTTAGSPFYFNFHVGDLGHTFICGPSGSGKTVVQNFMLAQLERFGAQQLFIDKDRGAEIFVRASGGTYLALRNGEPTGFAPFKALPPSPVNRAFLVRLVRALVARPDETLTVPEARAIDQGVAALEALPRDRRSIAALRSLLGQGDAGGVGARLERWQRGGPLGWVLDNEEDALGLETRFAGFDITQVLDHDEVRTPAMLYLFHRIAERVDGRRLVLDIDEFWKVLGDPAFTDLAQDGLKRGLGPGQVARHGRYRIPPETARPPSWRRGPGAPAGNGSRSRPGRANRGRSGEDRFRRHSHAGHRSAGAGPVDRAGLDPGDGASGADSSGTGHGSVRQRDQNRDR
ncbi:MULTISPECIES: TraG/VirB4 family ATPase [Brevundimonas]|mgnify:CR=1 FL=1|uniref:ATPase provides energy for both assembly of type IV secretion complex and secretion of T-DNA complex n=1 Tax=Brevundimonas abyssalis TAR-001 TaxID=1391729 RepID=A0A8E0NB32_9CAUL|nr:ATPase provides energy for both assembly of type IV secretion complex and secretion of T-DNA complex [Brevundimonas abyssalis]GAD58482.1 ATPase provides energy for both assembly of type IV secretion complex and secretion of T-DNA complex [Brevundimonas abyssalis TAR-001]